MEVGAVSVRRKGAGAGVARILAFLLVSGLVLAATGWTINAGLRRVRTGSVGVFNRIVDGNINAELLISGSSRALSHYDPRIIEKQTGLSTFNIGINGSQTDMQVAVFKAYLRHNKAPLLLVQNLDAFTFVTSRGGVYFPGQYLPYLKEDSIYEALKTVDPDISKARYLPLYGYAVEDMNFTWLLGLRGLTGLSPREDHYLGFLPRRQGWTGEFEKLEKSHEGGVRFDIDPEGVRDLEDLLQLCRREGIHVLLVYSPEYYEMQARESNRNEVFARFQGLAERYGAELWDYSRSPLSYDKKYFYNSQHLNADGAERFSAAFASALARSNFIAERTAVRRRDARP